MSRATEEWIGKNDDTQAPPRVRLRVFDRHNGICHISGRKIMPGDKWQLEHVTALILGGKNRESNLAPALVDPHKEKTADEVKTKAKIAATRKKHIGVTKPKQTIKSAGFATADKPHSKRIPLPPRRLYERIG